MLLKPLLSLANSGQNKKPSPSNDKSKKKMTQKEKDALEYKLWEMAEEYEEEE